MVVLHRGDCRVGRRDVGGDEMKGRMMVPNIIESDSDDIDLLTWMKLELSAKNRKRKNAVSGNRRKRLNLAISQVTKMIPEFKRVRR